MRARLATLIFRETNGAIPKKCTELCRYFTIFMIYYQCEIFSILKVSHASSEDINSSIRNRVTCICLFIVHWKWAKLVNTINYSIYPPYLHYIKFPMTSILFRLVQLFIFIFCFSAAEIWPEFPRFQFPEMKVYSPFLVFNVAGYLCCNG